MTPCIVVYVVGAGMYGVWFAGLMNPQPIAITISTIVTLVMTMMPLTNADSCVPRMSSSVRTSRIPTAGTFMMPCSCVPGITSSGECDHTNGTCMPTKSSTLLKYSLHAIATVAAPTAYSSTRSQPMIHAMNSPIVAYE